MRLVNYHQAFLFAPGGKGRCKVSSLPDGRTSINLINSGAIARAYYELTPHDQTIVINYLKGHGKAEFVENAYCIPVRITMTGRKPQIIHIEQPEQPNKMWNFSHAISDGRNVPASFLYPISNIASGDWPDYPIRLIDTRYYYYVIGDRCQLSLLDAYQLVRSQPIKDILSQEALAVYEYQKGNKPCSQFHFLTRR